MIGDAQVYVPHRDRVGNNRRKKARQVAAGKPRRGSTRRRDRARHWRQFLAVRLPLAGRVVVTLHGDAA